MKSNQPKIIDKSYSGTSTYNLKDDMLMHREIECIGEINSESVNSLIAQIRYLNYQSQDKPITLYINSHGGEVMSGLVLYDIMMATTCPIHTVCIGNASSMGALIFAAGDKRMITKHSKVMIHDPLIKGNLSASALNMKNLSEDLMEIRQLNADILAKHTGNTIDVIYEKTKQDTYFLAEEAIEFGLADEVFTKFER